MAVLEGQKYPGSVHLWKYRQTNFNAQAIVSFMDWLSDVLLIHLYIVYLCMFNRSWTLAGI